MTYTLGVPFDGQSLGNSKPQIRSNFNVINSDFAVNHIAFGSTGEGKHKFMQMPEQGSNATTGSDEGALYTKVADAYTNLFWRQESGGADPAKNQGAVIQMTNLLPINASNGSTFLPGGLLLQFGVATLSGGAAAVVYPYAFSLGGVANNAWSIQVTVLQSQGAAPRVVSVSTGTPPTSTGFNISSFGLTNQTVYWMAIGPRT